MFGRQRKPSPSVAVAAIEPETIVASTPTPTPAPVERATAEKRCVSSPSPPTTTGASPRDHPATAEVEAASEVSVVE